MRRAVDLVAAPLMLLVLSPMLAVGVATVAATGGRPLFFGRRLGRGGLPTGSDPRVPRWGRWLRRTDMDEIAQLFNAWNRTVTLDLAILARSVVAVLQGQCDE